MPDATPQIEPIRIGGPNKPYAIDGHTYVPLTDDRAVTEKGLASWYGKRFHGHRTASGEAYNMYAMTAAHKTLPIPSYARVRNPANGHEVIVRVNDRGPFSPGRVIDLSYTAALKLGVLGGVQPVEITRITADDIRTGAAFAHGGAVAGASAPTVGDLDRPVATSTPADKRGSGFLWWRRKPAAPAPATDATGVVVASGPPVLLPPTPSDVVAAPMVGPGAGPVPADTARGAPGAGTGMPAGVDLGSAAAEDTPPAVAGTSVMTTVTTQPAAAALASPAGAPSAQPVPVGVVLPPPPDSPASAPTRPPEAGRTAPRDDRWHAETTAGAGWYVQLGAFRQRDGALELQHRLIDEQPWLAPLLAVVTDRGFDKLQAGPYRSREQARQAADRVRETLHLLPTIVDKH